MYNLRNLKLLQEIRWEKQRNMNLYFKNGVDTTSKINIENRPKLYEI